MAINPLLHQISLDGLMLDDQSEIAAFLSLGDRSLGARSADVEPSRGSSYDFGGGFTKGGPEIRALSAGPTRKPARPESTVKLERILSQTYNAQARITGIRQLPMTRTKVKEVSYSIGDGAIYTVWVFKADPVATLVDLKRSYIISEAGVSTSRPVGYIPDPNDMTYPCEIAVLGGILNHVSDYSYKQLIGKMAEAPDMVHGAALVVAGIIADYHMKLLQAKGEFERYHVDVPRFDIGHEIRERLLRGIGVEDYEDTNVVSLIDGFESLDGAAGDLLVPSHNDIHPGNVLPLKQEGGFDQTGMSYNRFGVIDWREMAMDTPHGDMWDFWLHHKRLADSIVAGSYDYGFDDFEAAYAEGIAKSNGGGTEFQPSQLGSLIKSAERRCLEMYDPTRKNARDIQTKAELSCRELMEDLGQLRDLGFREQVDKILHGLRGLLHDKEYLRPILN